MRSAGQEGSLRGDRMQRMHYGNKNGTERKGAVSRLG